MEERMTIIVNDLDPNFKYEVAATPGGENIKRCFACGVCTGGCPVREVDERYNPRRIIAMVLLGMRDEVLKSDFIWLCSTCHTCYERCPQDVRITDVMIALRNIAVRSGYIPPSFVKQAELIKTYGRLYEIDEFDNQKREKADLPPVKSRNEEVSKIFEIVKIPVAQG
ncbi:MAG: 4Fe-4S dicluster domain-containing protein [bacterium]